MVFTGYEAGWDTVEEGGGKKTLPPPRIELRSSTLQPGTILNCITGFCPLVLRDLHNTAGGPGLGFKSKDIESWTAGSSVVNDEPSGPT